MEKKERLDAFFNAIDVKGVDLTNAKSLSNSIETLRESASPELLEVINRKFLTCLTQAKYVTVDDKEPEEY